MSKVKSRHSAKGLKQKVLPVSANKDKLEEHNGGDMLNTKESRIYNALWDLAKANPKNIFNFITKQLTKYIDVELAMICSVNTDGKGTAKTISLFNSNNHMKNFSYELEFTPCRQVIKNRKTTIYNSNVQKLFPKDSILKNMSVKSYIGSPIIDSNNNTIGIMIVMSKSKILEVELAQEIFSIHQARVSIELDRMIQKQMLQISEKKNKRLAEYDLLTGILNRWSFTKLVQQKIESINNSKELPALLLIDIDFFKSINDSLGHHVGDTLLKKIICRIQDKLPKKCTLGRLGGDEFVVLLPNTKQSNSYRPESVAHKIISTFKEPFVLFGYNLEISCSIGISYWLDGMKSSSDLLKNADIAMYQAKRNGKNTIEAYNTELSRLYNRRVTIEHFLSDPKLENQLQVVYQPQINLRTKKTYGYEALVRWNAPNLELVMPDEFIKIAEHMGRIDQIDLWVLKTSCNEYVKRILPLNPETSLSVNISAKCLSHTKTINQIKSILKATNFPAKNLVLEITETSIMNNFPLSIKMIHALKKLGIRIALDDFGSGFSSLNRLSKLPISFIKIDKSFLDKKICAAPNIMINIIISIAKSMNIQCIIEGVATKSQYKEIYSTGCQLIQGFYFSKPKVLNELLEKKWRNCKFDVA